MRRTLPMLVLLLATASCGRIEDNSTAESDNRPANASDAMTDSESLTSIPPELPARRGRASRETGPDLDPSAAPGVAFEHSYSFRLEAERIAEMQQEHQRLCARYGPACRITGMDYRGVNEDDVEASLSFLVDPEIAGQFGRESVRAVEAADGTLAGNEVTGTEIGTAIKTNVGNLEEAQAELARVEARLSRPNLHRRERARLNEERRELRAQIAELRTTTAGQEHRLATTPMRFRYGSGALAPGAAPRQTIGEATENAAESFLGGLNILAIVFVTLSPWLLTLLLIWGAIRFLRRRLGPATPAGAETEASA
jgi:hypothetical protein